MPERRADVPRWPWRGLPAVRMVFAAGLLLAGAAVLVPAGTRAWWQVSIALTEIGYLLAPAALLLLWPGWSRARGGLVVSAMGLVAAALLMTPLVRAVPVSGRLPQELAAAFGEGVRLVAADPDAPRRASPLDPLTLFTGVRVPEHPAERLPYARRGAQELALDLYRHQPVADGRPVPIVVVIHGGGWQTGDPTEIATLGRYLASQGYVVAAPEYRLAPVHPFPAAYDDLCTALEFLRGRASQWQADADTLVLIGRSAGGHLALLVAYRSACAAVAGVVALYPPTDLRFGWEHPGNPAVYDGRQAIEDFLGGPPAQVSEVYRAASPSTFVGADTPPTLLIHGRKDEVVWVEHSRRLARQLAEARRPHLLVELPWATHGCDLLLAGPCGQITLYAIERFVAAVTAH